MNFKLIAGLAVISLLAGAYIMLGSGRHKEVEVVTPVTAPVVQAVYATGTVEAGVMIPISPKIGARLITLEADEGAVVEKDQLLAQFEDTDIQSGLKELEARFALANNDLRRAQTLAKTGAISKSGLDQARAAQKTAQAAVDRSKAELSYLQLLAPESGTIIKRDGEIGEMIPLNQPVFWMTGGNKMRIETEVDEEDISLVKAGQDVVISADAFPNQIFNGKVQSITPKGDPVARSYRVRVSLDETTPLMIGMTAETNIITKRKDSAMMIPAGAVSQNKVMVIKDGRAQSVVVETGIKTPRAIEVISGIAAEDKVVQVFNTVLTEEKLLKAKTVEWKPAADE